MTARCRACKRTARSAKAYGKAYRYLIDGLCPTCRKNLEFLPGLDERLVYLEERAQLQLPLFDPAPPWTKESLE